MSPGEIAAAEQRIEQSDRQHKERMARLAEQHSNKLLGRVS